MDLLNQTYSVFIDIISFINKITNTNGKINKIKIKEILRSTTFEKLKKNEQDKGFSEAIISNKNKNKKITFFNLGPENDWKKILNKNTREKLEEIFKKELVELSYL